MSDESGGQSRTEFLILNAMIGVMAGLSLATALAAGNVAGLTDLMRASVSLPAGWSLLGLTFAAGYGFLAVGTGVMLLPGIGIHGTGRRAAHRSRNGDNRMADVHLTAAPVACDKLPSSSACRNGLVSRGRSGAMPSSSA